MTTEDLQGLEDQIGALDERIGNLEEGMGATGGDAATGGGDATAGEDNEALFGDPQSLIGQEVTVSAEVSELFTTTGSGSAYRIAGEGGGEIPVISTTPVQGLDADDIVRVTGTVVQVRQDSFEQDFGIAADELFEDPAAFFEADEGGAALNASRAVVLQEQGSGG